MNSQLGFLGQACLCRIHPDIIYIGLTPSDEKLTLNFIVDASSEEETSPSLKEALNEIISYYESYNHCENGLNGEPFEVEIEYSKDGQIIKQDVGARHFYIRFVPYDDYESL